MSVTSVFGRTGVVVAANGDYSAAQVGADAVLVPTAVKTANYAAAAADLVACDISGGSFTVTLPTAPADGTRVAVEIVKRITTGAPTFVTVATGGSDVLFLTGGATSGIMGRGTTIWQYKASGAIWYSLSPGDLLPTGFEFGYDQVTTSSISITSTTEATPTTVITCAAHVFDGAPVVAEFFAPSCSGPPSQATTSKLAFVLFESTTEIARLSVSALNIVVGASGISLTASAGGKFRAFTPSAGSHTYILGAFVNAGTGTIFSGAGGPTTDSPTWIRFTKA